MLCNTERYETTGPRPCWGNVKRLPPPLLADDVSAIEKLVYMWIRDQPGEHSTRSLDDALGERTRAALSSLVQRGVVIQETPSSGRRPGTYRATPLRELRQDEEKEEA